METVEIINEKVFKSPQQPPKISLKHDWMKEMGSEVARQAEGSQPTQPNPNPIHDRTWRPVETENTSRSSAQEIDTRFSRDCKNTNLDEDADHDRTWRPVVIGQPIGYIVKDDSGAYVVFTEQGSSASPMTAAKVMDIISRLPGCAGQAADAVSACTQVKMEDAPKL